MRKFGGYDVDLFASRVNAQLKCMFLGDQIQMLWMLMPSLLNWSNFRAFCFPPLSLISRVLQMLEPCQAECVIVVPFWTTQVWFSKLINCW